MKLITLIIVGWMTVLTAANSATISEVMPATSSTDEASVDHTDGFPLSPVCWPLNFAGIVIGVTTDAQVQRLLGKGVAKKEVESNDRYYVDQKETATLHTVSTYFGEISELTVEQGITVSAAEKKEAHSRWFDAQENFGNWHKLHLGSTKENVLSNLGAPQEKTSPDAWKYETKCACELPVYFTLFFRDDHIYKVVFTAETD